MAATYSIFIGIQIRVLYLCYIASETSDFSSHMYEDVAPISRVYKCYVFDASTDSKRDGG